MKERVEVQRVEAYDYEQTVYGCDACDFEDRDPDEVTRHCGEAHAVKATRTIGGVEFHYFETEADLDAKIASKDQSLGWPGRGVDGPLPGWYGSHWEEEDCARGCCREGRARYQPLAWWVTLWSKEKERADAEARGFAAALEQAAAAPTLPVSAPRASPAGRAPSCAAERDGAAGSGPSEVMTHSDPKESK